MKDLYLRFDDEDAWTAAAIERDPGLVEVDVIGVIMLPANGDAEPVALPGWHVNIRCADDRDLTALEEHQVFPRKPSRVWL